MSGASPSAALRILHVDMDAFFASVEQRDRPELRGKPVIVGAGPHERGVVSTCSYEARKFGVHSAMPSREAYRLCPQGVFVHPDMKRYFMTIEEAVSLVLQAASRDERAIYTLDMGEPVKILDLAEGMIEQAGYRPYVDVPIVFTGIRPGEKLFEEIDVSEKSAYRTDMAKIYITKAPSKF